jgi:hypothetical protein
MHSQLMRSKAQKRGGSVKARQEEEHCLCSYVVIIPFCFLEETRAINKCDDYKKHTKRRTEGRNEGKTFKKGASMSASYGV